MIRIVNSLHSAIATRLCVLMFGCIVLLSSCHTTKIVNTDYSGTQAEKARYAALVKNNYKYDALQSKVKYSLGSTSMGGKLCVESGERVCMQVNAPLIGFEIARVEASGESILLVDKYDKLYSNLNLSELYQIDDLKGHEVEALECIMLGRIFIPRKGQASAKDYELLQWSNQQNSDGTVGLSEGIYKGSNYTLQYLLDNSGKLVSTLLTVDGKSILWQYANYKEVESGKWVPTLETVTATQDAEQTITLAISLTNPSFGKSDWRDFSPSDSYKEVTIKELGEAAKAIAK